MRLFSQEAFQGGGRGCREVYEMCQPGFRGRCTAPLVVDIRARRLVSNESSDIVRNLNALQLPGASDVDLVPPHLAVQIDQLNDLVYNQVTLRRSPLPRPPRPPALPFCYTHSPAIPFLFSLHVDISFPRIHSLQKGGSAHRLPHVLLF